MKTTLLLLFALSLPFCLCAQTKEEEKAIKKEKRKQLFKDEEDGAFDVSNFLFTKSGFLVVPTIITEPAIGYGGLLNVMFFHGSMAEKKTFPAITGIMGGGTENGTWLAGIWHMNSWKGDRIRYIGAFGKPYMKMDYYGLGLTDILRNNPVLITYDAWVLVQDVSFRLAESNFFLGGRFVHLDTDNSLEFNIDQPYFQGREFNSKLSELGISFAYDTRDNVLTPSKGVRAELAGNYSDQWLGADNDYGRIMLFLLGWSALNERTILGVRYEAHWSIGDIPFYAKPFVDMRGVATQRYQDDRVALIETELRYNFYKRWWAIGFTGMGNAYKDGNEFADGNTVYTLGTGFRYLIARKLGLQMGVDVAKSNDDFAFKIIFGSGWMR